MTSRKLSRISASVLAGVMAVGLAACASSDADDNPSGSDDSGPVSGERFTPEEVLEATAPYDVKSIYAVPRDLSDDWVLAYINPNPGFPFFKTMSEGYKDAAEYYGVDLLEADLGNFNFADAVPKYEQLAIRGPHVVGILTPSGEALRLRTEADGVKLLPNGLPIEGADGFIGTENFAAGEMGGEVLAERVQERLDGDWQGRELLYVGLSQQASSVTVERVEGGLEGLNSTLGSRDTEATYPDLGKSATIDDGLRVMTDVLTANPDEAIAVMAMNDEVAVGAVQAAKAAGREDDVLIASVGGDELGRDTMRSDPEVLVAMVDLNPYAAGWRWVEAAIALCEGEEFTTPSVDRVLTPDNVDELYPTS